MANYLNRPSIFEIATHLKMDKKEKSTKLLIATCFHSPRYSLIKKFRFLTN